MQWYLLFNVLSGVRSVPADLLESMRSLGLKRRAVYLKLVLPAAMPSLVTGSVAAWGGGWNSLIVSEYVVFRERTYSVLGVGALINRATYAAGDRTLLLISVATLVVVVVLINRFFWQPVYAYVNERFRLEGA
jgi:NitT/TauT family transport system permease protein